VNWWDTWWIQVIFIFCLILANGFFALSEIAIIVARKSHIKQLAEQGNRKAKVVHRLQEDPERLLATTQIGVTVVSSMAAAVGGVAAVEVLKPMIQQIAFPMLQKASEGIALAIVVVTISYFSLIVGELVPKSLALRNPEKLALWVGIPVDALSRLSSFFIKIVTRSGRIFLWLLGSKAVAERTFISEEEIKFMLREGREKGVFDSTEQELIHSVFEFTDISVKEVMVPRPKMYAIQIDTPPEQVLAYIAENKFTRYPVYNNDIGDISGLLYDKDFLGALAKKQPIVLKDLLHPAYFVPETMKVSRLLKELQRRRMQMAMVVNEYGSVEGLVTMEDLIEEIVGEIRDEFDIEERPVERLKDGSLVIEASLSVRDLKQDYFLPLPESSEYETLGGFVLSQLQTLPRGGEIIQHGDYKFTIVDMEGRRIVKIKVEKIAQPAELPPIPKS
ncbi:MAG TPA: hemolysin family protein, partial [Nitrospiria bacterium]|nr:hemolysin family protein [Nitrospiria bacterium]